MKSDGTHQMTTVTNRKKDGVLTYSMSCNDCSRKAGPLNGRDGQRTIEDLVRSHQTSTRTEAEIRRRNERMGR